MELTLVGNLLLERNPMFKDPEQSLGSNTLKYLILTSFESDTITTLKNIQQQYNHGQPLKDQYSLPFQFGFYNGSAYAQVQAKFRNPKSDTLLKQIVFTSKLFKMPLDAWIGKVLSVRVRLFKYGFTSTNESLTPSETVIEGGSKRKLRGITFHIKSIDII